MDLTADLLLWLKAQGVEFRLPAVLWALMLVPALAVFYAGARRSRRHVARAFRVTGYRPRRTWRGFVRGLSLAMLWLGLAGAVVGFARPVLELPTPEDSATVVMVIDASLAMRATDVRPTRIDAGKGAVRQAINALPERIQVALVAYSASAYILQAPTHDHGAVPAALGRLRTADGAALGDALFVALAAIPQDENAPPAAGPQQRGAPKVPSAIVLVATGEMTAGRTLGEAVMAVREAGVPVHVVGIGPRQGDEQKAAYDEQILRQLAQATGGRYLAGASGGQWREVLRSLGSSVEVDVRPQEVGHYVGAGGLVVMGLAMLVMLAATRRLV